MNTYEEIEIQYSDYLAVMKSRGGNTYPDCPAPHCDMWVLHSLGACDYCDDFPHLQRARRELNIAFTDEQQSPLQRPCPATLLRPVERIHRWGGNAPRREWEVEESARRFEAQLRALLEENDK